MVSSGDPEGEAASSQSSASGCCGVSGVVPVAVGAGSVSAVSSVTVFPVSFTCSTFSLPSTYFPGGGVFGTGESTVSDGNGYE